MNRVENHIALDRRYGAHNYDPIPVVLARGEGCVPVGRRRAALRRHDERLFGGQPRPRPSAHPRGAERAGEAARHAVARLSQRPLGPFLEELCELTGLDAALPMNTGAEAVETAIKAARRWGYRVKGVPRDRAEIIVAHGNFHGRTTTIVGFSVGARVPRRLRTVRAGLPRRAVRRPRRDRARDHRRRRRPC